MQKWILSIFTQTHECVWFPHLSYVYPIRCAHKQLLPLWVVKELLITQFILRMCVLQSREWRFLIIVLMSKNVSLFFCLRLTYMIPSPYIDTKYLLVKWEIFFSSSSSFIFLLFLFHYFLLTMFHIENFFSLFLFFFIYCR